MARPNVKRSFAYWTAMSSVGLHRADRLGRDQRLGDVPGALEHVRARVEQRAACGLQAHVAERPRRVEPGEALDLDAGAAGLDGHGARDPVAVHADDHEQRRLGRVGHPGHGPVDGHLVAGAAHGGRGGAGLATLGLDGPAAEDVARRPGRGPRDTGLAGRDRLEARRRRRVEDRGGRQRAEQGDRREDAPALLGHEHRLEHPEARAAALLGDEQPGPAGLAGRRPQVGQVAALQRAVRGLDGLEPREGAAGGLAEELLLVAQRQVHREHLPSGSDMAPADRRRAVIGPPPPSPWRAAR